MVIYHVITTFHLLSGLIHKFYFHKDETAVLVIPDFMQDKMEINRFDELIKKDVFEQVVIFPYRKLGQDYKQIKKNTLDEFDKVFRSMKLKEHKIYVYGAHFYFTLGLVTNHIKYDVFEEASGAYTHQNILLDAVRNSSPVMESICRSFNTLFYDNEWIEKVWIDYNAQEGNFQKSRTLHYNMMECIQKLDDKEKEILYSFFRVPEVHTSGTAALLLTQHFMNLGIMTYDEQAELYKTYADSFLSNQEIYIKPHPDDFMDYENHLKNCKVIKGRFPIELLALRKDSALSTVATVYSTAVYTVGNLFENVICLDMNYRETYKFFYQYYMGIKIMERLFADGQCWTCQGVGIDFKATQEMLKHRSGLHIDIHDVKDGLLQGRTIYLIGQCDETNGQEIVLDLLQHISEKDIVIFLNLDERALGWIRETELLNNIIPIAGCINTRDYNIWDQEERIIYIYVEDEKKKQEIKNMSIHEEFHNLETILDVEPMDEKQIRIKVLEGVLKATEERLKDELKKNETGDEGNENYRGDTSPV